MTRDELVAAVAAAAGIQATELTPKERPGAQIKANALWEGSCGPSRARREVGLFLAEDSEDLAIEGAILRMSLQVQYPEAALVVFPDSQVDVFGYSDSVVASNLSAALGVDLQPVERPAHARDVPPPETLDATTLANSLREWPNAILTGPPGTGKTSLALELVRFLTAPTGHTVQQSRFHRLLGGVGNDFNRLLDLLADPDSPPVVWELVQAHPGYSYDDLIRRIAPRSEGGNLRFVVEDRLLPLLCQLASAHPNKTFVLLIDEINRCNLAATLGEFVFAIDPGHRGTPVRLQYQGSSLPATVSVPANVWLVGTMNSADRSLAVVDYAIRRRFRFLPVPARAEVVEGAYVSHPRFATIAMDLFTACNEGLPPSIAVGHSFFMVEPVPESTWPQRIARRIAFHVAPLLREYWREGARNDQVFRWGGAEFDLQDQYGIASGLEELITAAWVDRRRRSSSVAIG